MDALGRFNIHWEMLAAQLVNFLVVAFVIWRFLLRPVMATMKSRREKIAQGLADADAARSSLAGGRLRRGRRSSSRLPRTPIDSWKTRATKQSAVRAASLERAGRDADRLNCGSARRHGAGTARHGARHPGPVA